MAKHLKRSSTHAPPVSDPTAFNKELEPIPESTPEEAEPGTMFGFFLLLNVGGSFIEEDADSI